VESTLRTSHPGDAARRLPGTRQPIIDLLPYGVVIADPAGSATGVNGVWTVLTGQAERDWRGQGWFDVCVATDREARHDELLAAVGGGQRHEADWTIDGQGEGRRTLHIEATPDLDGGHLVRIVVTATDVTEDRARSAHLLDRATHDSLTGLFNRPQFLEFLGHALERRRRAPELAAAVLFVDVDDLKATNDRFGHSAGDQVLRDVAARIRAGVRPSDVIARYGGDEFTVLCEDLGDASEAFAIADRIRDWAQGDPPHAVSVGVAIADEAGAVPASIVEDADRAMYSAKREHGRAAAGARSAVPDLGRVAASESRLRPQSDDWPKGGGFDGVDVLAVAAHELRSPLTAIGGFASTLRSYRDQMSPADVDAAFAILERQTQRLAAMLDQLLDLGRYHRDTPQPTAVDLADVVADALEAAPPPAHVKLTIASDPPTSPLVVAAERSNVTRVLVNLLTNAYRYGGPNVAIESHNGGRDVDLSVQDDGRGVPRALEPGMFAPFVHGPNPGPSQLRGNGLGLALARGIAESFRGH
jgi:diguanylate cyclase (GGDEF)-like protein